MYLYFVILIALLHLCGYKPTIMVEKKQEAQYLFIAGGRTQKEIADIVGVSERTVHTWVHQYAWHKLRLAAFQAPATIADGLCAQLVELQASIAAREPGHRFATPQEAEVMRKLIVSLDKMKKTPSLSLNMQVLETFRNYVRPLNKQFAIDLADYTGRFLSGKSRDGYAPYELEYGIAPLSPYYDEPDEPPLPPPIACPDKAECKHPGNCVFPACFLPKPTRPDPMLQYAIPPIVYQHTHSSVQAVMAEHTEHQQVIPPHLAAVGSLITPPSSMPPSLPLPDPLSASSASPEETRSISATITSAPAKNNIVSLPHIPTPLPLPDPFSDSSSLPLPYPLPPSLLPCTVLIG